jgi:hypothetical protein
MDTARSITEGTQAQGYGSPAAPRARGRRTFADIDPSVEVLLANSARELPRSLLP